MVRLLGFVPAFLLAFSAAYAQPIPSRASGSSVAWSTASFGAGTTNYTVPGNSGTVLTIGGLASKSGIISNLFIRVTTAPASAQSDVYTVYVGTPGAMTATGVTCSVAAAANTCSDVTDVATITAGQAWAVQVVTGATNATGASMYGVTLP